MNDLGVTLSWILIETTAVAAVAIVAYLLARRAGPHAGKTVALAAIVLMTCVSIVAFIPGFEGRSLWPLIYLGSTASEHESHARQQVAATASGREDAPATELSHDTRSTPDRTPFADALAAFWSELEPSTSIVPVDAAQVEPSWNWAGWVALILLSGLLLGLLRLIAGLIWVGRFRRSSITIIEKGLRQEWEILATNFSRCGNVELRETKCLSSAATVGWLRPVVLLPSDWRDWSSEECRAVLAHELAHIQSRDYLNWIVAQFGLLLHFYHPLAHWLCAQLRLDQELAADVLAARMCGGSSPYLKSLAQLILRHENTRLVWPAQTFLPTRRTFVRRVEMLRNARSESSRSAPSVRWIAVTGLVVASLFAVGMRSPRAASSANVLAQEPASTAASHTPFSLDYIPRDAAVVVAIRPAEIAETPSWSAWQNKSLLLEFFDKQLGLALTDVRSAHLVFLPLLPEGPEPVFFVLRLANKKAADRMVKTLAPEPKTVAYDGTEYQQGPATRCIYRPEESTVVIANAESVIRRVIVAGKPGAQTTRWNSKWQTVADHAVAVLLRPDPIAVFNKGLGIDSQERMFDYALGSVEFHDGSQLRITFKFFESVSGGFPSLLTQRRADLATVLSNTRLAIASQGDASGPDSLRAIDLADGLLERMRITQDSGDFSITSDAPADDLGKLLGALTPMFFSAREGAQRMQASNNLKQIGLAFHNYLDTHQMFVPAVVYSANGVPRSWRVELLPYLDQQALYERYRKDEPWDSEHNKSLIELMPAVYRTAVDDPSSTNSSYYVLTGPGTVFDKKIGTRLAEILDGTSNTILAVESRLQIPWTKPEDIPYSDNKPVPKLGGFYKDGFNAVRCDGSVVFISSKIEEPVLRAVITKGDGLNVHIP